MPLPRYEQALELLEAQRGSVLALVPEGTSVVDVHTHLGLDEDGMSLTLEDHLASMTRNRVDRSFVFALNDPERVPGYRVPNDRVLAWAEQSEGRLVPYVRLALDTDDPVSEARRCVDRGARGIKLHPRSQAFSVADPRFEQVFAFASERHIPVLIHAGRGLPMGLGAELAGIAERHPGARLILAHAAIADQAAIASFAAGMPNVFFDTSTWSPLDILSLLGRVGPEQVLFASDIPYGDQLYHQLLTIGALRRAGCDDELVRAVMGGTALRLLEGQLPHHISPPIADGTIALGADRARMTMYLAAVTPQLFSGQADRIGFLGLAAACCIGDPDLELLLPLLAAVEAAWLEIAEAELEDRASLTRQLSRLIGIVQARVMYAGTG
jgi:predicted TIM-barrel fold metal-dependent hydrolase